MGGGKTWENPYKYFIDALELEKQVMTELKEDQLSSNWYHLFYLAKSYADCLGNPIFLFGSDQKKHIAERSQFYFEKFIKVLQPDFPKKTKELTKVENDYLYFALYLRGLVYQDSDQIIKAIDFWHQCFKFDPKRNESLIPLCEYYLYHEDDIPNTTSGTGAYTGTLYSSNTANLWTGALSTLYTTSGLYVAQTAFVASTSGAVS